MEASLPQGRNRLALFLRPLPSLRLRWPLRIPHPRLRQSAHPRRRPLLLQLVRQHHHDSRRNPRRTSRSSLVRHLLLLATRTHRLRFLHLLVLRKFPLHRHLHGRRPLLAPCASYPLFGPFPPSSTLPPHI